MRIVLYEPDNPQNFGTILRTAACFGAELHIVEPCGFPVDDARIRRGALDYAEHISYTRHASWPAFLEQRQGGRIILMTTRGATPLHEVALHPDDWLIFGRETAGVPDSVHDEADLRAVLPMKPGLRSLNIAVSVGIVIWEGTRQATREPIAIRNKAS